LVYVVVVVFAVGVWRWGGVSGRLKESLLGGVWIVEVTLGLLPALVRFLACAGGGDGNFRAEDARRP
jgi:hypothetical protein